MPYVRALRDFETATNKVRKGQTCDLSAEQADAAIARGDAQALALENAVVELTQAQRAVAVQPEKRILK